LSFSIYLFSYFFNPKTQNPYVPPRALTLSSSPSHHLSSLLAPTPAITSRGNTPVAVQPPSPSSRLLTCLSHCLVSWFPEALIQLYSNTPKRCFNCKNFMISLDLRAWISTFNPKFKIFIFKYLGVWGNNHVSFETKSR